MVCRPASASGRDRSKSASVSSKRRSNAPRTTREPSRDNRALAIARTPFVTGSGVPLMESGAGNYGGSHDDDPRP